MVLRYAVCDVELPNPRKFPYLGNFLYPGFLQIFIHDLIPGLLHPRNFPYPVKVPIHKSEYLLNINNNQNHKLAYPNDSLYIIPPFLE